jgi:hypothetical protein
MRWPLRNSAELESLYEGWLQRRPMPSHLKGGTVTGTNAACLRLCGISVGLVIGEVKGGVRGGVPLIALGDQQTFMMKI